MPGLHSNFIGKFSAEKGRFPSASEVKRFQDMRGMNGMKFDSGEASQGDQEAKQRMMQNMMTAHHTGGGVGLDGFKEPSLEDLVEMVRQGKIGKEVLGDRADEFLEYGTPSQREKRLKETGSLEIPVQPFKQMRRDIDAERIRQMMPTAVQGPDEDDLSFLKDFISRMA